MRSLDLRLRNEVGKQLSQKQLGFFFSYAFVGEWGREGGVGGGSIVQLTFHDAGKLNLFPEQSDPISPGWE